MLMNKIFFSLVFILSSINVMADPEIDAEDFIPKGMIEEHVYNIGYSSKKIESSFAIIVYNPSKDERGVVILNKTRNGRYIKIAENLKCLLGDSGVGAAGIDDYKTDNLSVNAEKGTLSISYSHSQCGDTCHWTIMDSGVRLDSYGSSSSCSTGSYTVHIDFDKMQKYVTMIERRWEWDEDGQSGTVDEITQEEYKIYYDKGGKTPTFEKMNFISGDHGIHYKEKFLKSESREER